MKNSPLGKQYKKKIAVNFSSEIDEQLCIELLSVIYQDSDIIPILLEEVEQDDECLHDAHRECLNRLIVDVEKEIIPVPFQLYNSAFFVLNYQKFYS